MAQQTVAIAFRDTSDNIKAVDPNHPLPVRPGINANGADYIADTNAHTGQTWKAIYAVTAAVAALVASDIAGTLTSVAIPAGITIYGTFTSITLASGSVIAYRA